MGWLAFTLVLILVLLFVGLSKIKLPVQDSNDYDGQQWTSTGGSREAGVHPQGGQQAMAEVGTSEAKRVRPDDGAGQKPPTGKPTRRVHPQ